MAKKWGNVDYRQFEKLKKELDKYERVYQQEFFEAAAKELAARLLAKVIKRTQPGEYPASSGKNGGTLRRGWTAHKSKGFEITQIGNTYQIEIINPVEYASYVEYGHRTRDHKGWVPGKFYLTKSEIELDAQAPKILEKKLQKFIEQIFNDR
ncbi:HK97 gp10 family phage protein [Alkaliphilus pronyensis]|uniref:HK97 gp10 family phage protein n=1 Tax=Alkaliphilus pronyensis TaxID=1482732 RepID=A0A6I0EZ52_9FIRM|nr:HK97 gp10 family phage protein [Alkaliphilus pronyensis]KAB3534419.1 HK97 gp10 family phage protein [Alkaliphilus pronyensis]